MHYVRDEWRHHARALMRSTLFRLLHTPLKFQEVSGTDHLSFPSLPIFCNSGDTILNYGVSPLRVIPLECIIKYGVPKISPQNHGTETEILRFAQDDKKGVLVPEHAA